MNSRKFFARLMTAAAVCAMLMLPCGCSEEPSGTHAAPAAPSVSFADVSGSDMPGWFAKIDEDMLTPVYTLIENAAAIEQRDIDAYMATIDPESDAFESTREDAAYMFAHYRLSVTINDLSIESSKGDTVVISVTQTTLPVVPPEEPVSGTDVSASDVSASDIAPLSGRDLTENFTPCVTQLTHTLTRRGDGWFITSTVVDAYHEMSEQASQPSLDFHVSPADVAADTESEQ